MPILNIAVFIVAGKMKSLTLFIFLLASHAALSQIRNLDNYISWSGTRTLTINDSAIKTSPNVAGPVRRQTALLEFVLTWAFEKVVFDKKFLF